MGAAAGASILGDVKRLVPEGDMTGLRHQE